LLKFKKKKKKKKKDIYCYSCNDSKLDNHLADHLNNFGINIKSQKKTEKNITELVIIYLFIIIIYYYYYLLLLLFIITILLFCNLKLHN